jgi:UDP-N-acetylglucosamine 2-epimerase (non-hydrolysing)
MKASAVLRALAGFPQVKQTLVHTGQHYDSAMSEVFFKQLEIPEPDFNLGVGSGSHSEQVARVMLAFEPILLESKPNLVLVYGDVNSTLAAALVCSKLSMRLGHVEAGLRSHDRTMPEEINRLLTDQLADFLFTPSSDGGENLLREGIACSKIHLVGNVMIDTLVRLLPRAQKEFPPTVSSPYALVTLHRPSNVDDLPWLRELLRTLKDLSRDLSIVFPVHPRTRKALNVIETQGNNQRVRFLEPLPYLEFLSLQCHSALVITDSGGIQEETTFLGIPCLTVRENTERPITLTQGTNQLVGRDPKKLRNAVADVLSGKSARRGGTMPAIPLWDGRAAERIARIVVQDACGEFGI